MTAPNLAMLERTAAAYEEMLVPALFEPWARQVVDTAEIGHGQRVLDVACGTGVLARCAAARAGSEELVAGLDSNPGMLAVAARTAPRIEWRQGEAAALPYPDARFDAVVCQFGLMFFADPAAALREMWRVLAPGGRVAVAVFAELDENPAYAAAAAVFGRVAGDEVATALRMPFALGSAPELIRLGQAAGLTSATVTQRHETARFAGVREMVLADVRGWFPLAGIHLEDATIDAVIGEAKAALSAVSRDDGAVEFPVAAHVLTARKG